MYQSSAPPGMANLEAYRGHESCPGDGITLVCGMPDARNSHLPDVRVGSPPDQRRHHQEGPHLKVKRKQSGEKQTSALTPLAELDKSAVVALAHATPRTGASRA
jgi:hypothetical protein